MAGETTSRLTLAAKALGFDESAKSVDLLAQAQARLAENQKQLEAAKSGGTIGDIAKLTAEQRNLAVVVDELSPSQERLNAKTQDYVGLLTRIHPELGQVAQAGVRAARVASELAGENVSLVGTFKSLKDGILQNVGALGLLGAGAAVVTGIAAISGAVARMRRDFEEANKAIRDQVEAFNDLRRTRDEQQSTIEQIADRRREGGLSADAAQQAQTSASSIAGRFGGDLEPDAVNRAVALLGDQGLDEDQLAAAAFSLQRGTLTLDERQSGSRRRAAFERASRRDRAAFEIFKDREAEQKGVSVAAVSNQATGADPSTIDLESFIRGLPGGLVSPNEVEAIAQIVRAKRGRSTSELGVGSVPQLLSNATVDNLRGQGRGHADLEAFSALLAEDGISARPDQIRTAEFVERQIDKIGRSGTSVVINNNQNSKHIVPGTRAQELARENGAAIADLAEMGLR